MSVGDATGAIAANIAIPTRMFTVMVRRNGCRNTTNWNNAPNTNAATNGKGVECRRNITALTITGEDAATIIMMIVMTTTTTIMAETMAEGELGFSVL
jgi:hypothetical protein